MEKITKYNYKNLFYLISLVWVVDFILTIIALNFKEGLYEYNFISAFFYSNGIIGYIINFILCMSILFFMSFFVCKLINRLKGERYKKILWYVVITLFLLTEGVIIINNIWLLIN
ncbi:unnamed protein product [marine sediment metagenome]|uniref:DUF5658 domain-containing protein n=1 Tax=marine sediment metagenome TaxID=412755 RepID=X1CFI2_9ZZZZ